MRALLAEGKEAELREKLAGSQEVRARWRRQ
jgi:hypothetical protein